MTQTPIMITDTEMSGNLKNVYSNYRTKLFPIATPFLAQIEKEGPGGLKNLKWGGNGVYFDLVLSPPVGWTSSRTGYFPNSTQETEKQGSMGVERLYISRAVDGLALVGTASKQAAYVPLQTKVLDSLDRAAQLMLQFVAHGSTKGVQAVITTVTDTDTIVCTSPYGDSTAGQGGLWMYPDMPIAVRSSDGATLRGRTKIANVTNSGDSATVNFASTVAGMQATDIIVACTDSDDSYGVMPNGAYNILNPDGSTYTSLHGRNSATAGEERWKAHVLTAGTDVGAADQAHELDIWDLAAQVGARSGIDVSTNKSQYLLTATKGLERQFIENALSQRERTVVGGERMKINADYDAVSVSGLPLVADPYHPAGQVRLFHLPSLVWVDAADWSPVQYQDSGSWRPMSGRDAFETAFKIYMNLGTIQRNAHGMIKGYTDAKRYSPVM